jgi:hypothetical protein
MAHLVGRLTALKVAKVKKPGMYADGAGLYLQVSGEGENTPAKSWIYRFTLRGRSREMGSVCSRSSASPGRARRQPSVEDKLSCRHRPAPLLAPV